MWLGYTTDRSVRAGRSYAQAMEVMMRNLAQYPITNAEVIGALERLLADQGTEPAPGDMTAVLISRAIEIVRNAADVPQEVR
jgi:hypothetical protein